MENSSETHVYQVQVTFNSETKLFSFTGDISGGDIRIAFGPCQIDFELLTVPSSPTNAAFFEAPFHWPEPPGGMQNLSIHPQLVSLGIDNQNASAEDVEYPFEMRVTYDGQLYTSKDPTIITEPHEGPAPLGVLPDDLPRASAVPAGAGS